MSYLDQAPQRSRDSAAVSDFTSDGLQLGAIKLLQSVNDSSKMGRLNSNPIRTFFSAVITAFTVMRCARPPLRPMSDRRPMPLAGCMGSRQQLLGRSRARMIAGNTWKPYGDRKRSGAGAYSATAGQKLTIPSKFSALGERCHLSSPSYVSPRRGQRLRA